MNEIKLVSLCATVIVVALFTSSVAAEVRLQTHCPACGPGVMCSAVYTSATDTSYRVNTNVSGFHTKSCDGYPAGMGTDIKCAVEQFNRSMGDTQLSLAFNQNTPTNYSGLDSYIFKATDYFLDGGPGWPGVCDHGTCLMQTGVTVDQAAVNCAQRTIEITAVSIAIRGSTTWYYGPREPQHSMEILLPSNIFVSRQAIMHEFGHALGFDHVTSKLDIMNPKYPAGGWYRDGNLSMGLMLLTPDLLKGVQDLHGAASPNIEDIAATPFRLVGGQTQYGNAQRYLCPGDSFIYVFHYHNRGYYSEFIKRNIYLSSNPYVTTSDTLLRGENVLVHGHKDATFGVLLTVPDRMPFNTSWHLGYLLSENDGSSDDYPTNNQTSFAQISPSVNILPAFQCQ